MGVRKTYLSFDLLRECYLTYGLKKLKQKINKGDIIHTDNLNVDKILDIVYSGKCDTSITLQLEELFYE